MTATLLYGYYRSSAAYRVRLALALKGIAYEHRAVDLKAGAQTEPAYLEDNPQGRVPVLQIDGLKLAQSPAILDYLEERSPQLALLPADPADRAFARQAASLIACDIHPLNNLSVLRYLKTDLGQDQAAVDRWYAHWITEGFRTLETWLAPRSGAFAIGDAPGLIEVYLIPQLYNARRFAVPLDAFPTLTALETACLALPAFDRARPEVQPDAPKEQP